MADILGYRIVDRLQKFGDDIKPDQLRYHGKRVLVAKEFTFDSAHHLHAYEGKCKNLHGHTYKVEIGVSSYTDGIGLSIDFGDLKKMYQRRIHDVLDHRYLNEVLPPMNTTAENMVVWIFDQISDEIKKKNLDLHLSARVEYVRLYETPTSWAEARREWMEHV